MLKVFSRIQGFGGCHNMDEAYIVFSLLVYNFLCKSLDYKCIENLAAGPDENVAKLVFWRVLIVVLGGKGHL